MSRKFLFFINPISGTGRKDRILNLIHKKTSKANIPYEILNTNADGNYAYLPDKIAKENITDIIVCGGDGTVNQVAAVLQKTDIRIGIIPLGSGNGLAFAAGIPRSPSKALQLIFKGYASEIDGFYINEHFSCMLCGLGFDASVAHEFAKQPKRGLQTYITESIKQYLNASTYNFVIKLNDITITTEAFFISIANSNQFGNNVTIAPKASISDGLLDIIVVRKMNKIKLLFSIAKQIWFGEHDVTKQRKYNRDDILYYQTPTLTIQNIDNASMHIDGEPIDSIPEIDIKIVEKAFMLIQAE